MRFRPLSDQVILLDPCHLRHRPRHRTQAFRRESPPDPRRARCRGFGAALAAELPDALAALLDVARGGAGAVVQALASTCWGRIDTWINDAGVAIYGTVEEVTPQDHRRLFEKEMHPGCGGTACSSAPPAPGGRQRLAKIVTVGSQLSDRTPTTLQGPYLASSRRRRKR